MVAGGEFERDGWIEGTQVAPRLQEQCRQRLRRGPLACCGKEAFSSPGRNPREGGEQGVFASGCPLADVDIDEHEVEPVEQTRLERGEVPVDVPSHLGGIEAGKPVELSGPKAWMSACDGDVRFYILKVGVGGGLPDGAAGAFGEAEGFVEVDGFGVVGADVQPEIMDVLFAGVLHGAQGEGAGDAALTIVWMGGDVGDEVEAVFVLFERDEADVADDVVGFFPDVAGERQGGAICNAVRPFKEGVVGSGAAHILHVAASVVIHGGGEALFDEVRHGGQVSQDAEGTQVGVMFFARGDGDACHAGIIDAELGIGNGE